MSPDKASQVFREFVAVVKALRTPVTGCPWDLEQDHQSLRPYLVEESQEVLDAIDRSDDRLLQEELGDLLLPVVLHAQLADDRGAFSITDVVQGIKEKMESHFSMPIARAGPLRANSIRRPSTKHPRSRAASIDPAVGRSRTTYRSA